MESNTFADQLLDRLDQLKKQPPSEYFLQKMEHRAVQQHAHMHKLDRQTVLSIAASLLLLFMVNTYLLTSSPAAEYATESTEAYDLLATQFLYDE